MEETNVILFPKWQKTLESESLVALKEKRYDDALEKLNELIDYKIDHQEIMVGKMICLMELGQHIDAERFAESLLNREDEGYFHYMHIYLTILFQTNQYEYLMETVEQELEKQALPLVMREQFQQLYAISENMKRDLADEQSREDYAELEEALRNLDDHRQWVIITRLQSRELEPSLRMIELLNEEEVSPVVKTAILLWIQQSQVKKELHIRKFGKTVQFDSNELLSLQDNPFQRRVLFMLRNLEQENPTLYELIETLFQQYLYVRYPFNLKQEDAFIVAEALHSIAQENLNLGRKEEAEEKVQKYIEEIQICQALYLAVTDS